MSEPTQDELWALLAHQLSCPLEIDEAMIPGADWEAAKGGDQTAVERIAALLHGEILYFHAFGPPSKDWVKVTLRQLDEIGAICTIKLARTWGHMGDAEKNE